MTLQPRRRSRIGAWRLLDLVQATMSFRAVTFGASPSLPEYGPPDATPRAAEPDELPGSNIAEGEQQQAVARERARRFVRARRPGREC